MKNWIILACVVLSVIVFGFLPTLVIAGATVMLHSAPPSQHNRPSF